MGSISTQDPIEPPLVESSFDVPMAPYPTASAAALPSSPTEIKDIASRTIEDLNSMLDSKEYSLLSSLLLKSASYWRDHLGLSQTKFATLIRPQEIVAYIQENGGVCAIKCFTLDPSKESAVVNLDPKGTVKCIDVFVTFETETGRGKGILKLIQDVEDGDAWKIYTIFTSLSELMEFPFQDGFSRPLFSNPESMSKNLNWKDYRDRKQEFLDEEPAVLIVGAGHSGLMTAARLGMLGVSTLIIDKGERTGDSWRTRYHKLVLHDPCWMNAMPYLPYPPSWPVFASKDKMADFFEYYASVLELNIWNKTEVIETTWDEKKKHWTITLERHKDGRTERRTLHPRHLIQATGLNGPPKAPNVAGLEDFEGKVMHSSQFVAATPKYRGRKVVVVGAGNSAHDIAHDAYIHGADVTIIQRSCTFVLTLSTVLMMMKTRYNEGIPTDEVDLVMASAPTTLFKRISGEAMAMVKQRDKTLLDSLSAVGYKLEEEGEFPSLLYLTIHRAGGFYIDSGSGPLVAERKIKIKQGQEIARMNKHSITFADGEEMEADEIIFATGYANGRTRTRKVFGDSVADKIDPIWGFTEQGEIRGVWRRSGHPGFWVAAGSFWLSRYYSKLLALQIKAVEEGLAAP